MQQISLFRLFLVFLKIGATAFGGNIALVAAMRKDLCERRKLITDEQVLDFTTLGNLLPGPLATNVITACGYAIHGMAGAIAGLIGVLLPSFVLMCVLADLYFRYGELPLLTDIFGGLIAAVAAVITATVWSLAKKNVTGLPHGIILLGAAAAIFFLKGFLVTLAVIVVAGVSGYLLFSKRTTVEDLPRVPPGNPRMPVLVIGSIVIAGLLVYLFRPGSLFLQELRMLALTFGTMSVTLFGGGYVFIPAIEKVVVGAHGWVTSREFADGIAMGQVTPGPVAISAAFVGWKVAGFWGALVSTIGIFVPPALLMLPAHQLIDRIKSRPGVEAVFKGVRPAVIGMILASVWVIGKSAPQDWQSLVIFAVVLALSLWKDFDTAILFPLAGLLGWLLHLM